MTSTSRRIKNTIRNSNFYTNLQNKIQFFKESIIDLEYKNDEDMINQELATIISRLDSIEANVTTIQNQISTAQTKLASIETRLQDLEDAVFPGP